MLSLENADKYGSVYGQGGQTFVYHHEEDESSFQLVDTARIQKPQHQRSRGKYNQVSSKEKRIQSHVCSLGNIKGILYKDKCQPSESAGYPFRISSLSGSPTSEYKAS